MTVTPGWRLRGLAKLFCFLFLIGISFVFLAVAVQAQASSSSSPSQPPQSGASQEAQQPAAKAQSEEIVSRDSPATFKVRVNVVFVRVVVRDLNGKVITNLKKEDIQLADNRKLQVISTFAVETPGSHVMTVKMDNDSGPAPSEGTPVKLPQTVHHSLYSRPGNPKCNSTWMLSSRA